MLRRTFVGLAQLSEAMAEFNRQLKKSLGAIFCFRQLPTGVNRGESFSLRPRKALTQAGP